MTKIDNQVHSVMLLLQTMEVDGETMQHILEQIGMEEQMLRQLVLSADDDTLVQLLQERQLINSHK